MRVRLSKTRSYFYKGFTQLVTNSGYLLILATVVSLIVSNSALGSTFINALHIPLLHTLHLTSIEGMTNDVLMTLFFLIVAIELNYELTQGALNSLKLAATPIFAAIGGMLVPALIYYIININTATVQGWGIPMATDIAFALALYNLFGNALPPYLKTLLCALAVVDDFGSILAIALFYSATAVSLSWIATLIILIIVLIYCRTKITNAWFYIFMLCALWLCLYNIGVHPTMSAVIVGLIAPYPVTSTWIHALHKWVYYLIVPLFALINTAIVININLLQTCITSTVVWGVVLGLLVGKPLGITLGVAISQKLKLAHLPAGVNIKHVAMIGVLGGIGFTVSLFVSSLAFGTSITLLAQARIAILVAAVLTVLCGKLITKII